MLCLQARPNYFKGMRPLSEHGLFAVYGTGGYAREVMPLCRAALKVIGIPTDRLVFIDDDETAPLKINSHPVVRFRDFLRAPASSRRVAVAVAKGSTRQAIVERCLDHDIAPWSIFAQNTIVMDDAVIGDGAILNPFVTITSNVRIGRQFHANIYSYVAHDCVIGDFVTLAPRVCCNGNIHIGDHAYVGTNAVIKQGTPDAPLIIGEGAVIGMGAVVTKSVPPGVTVVGNPARPLTR